MTKVDEFCAEVERARNATPGSEEWHDAYARMRVLRGPAQEEAARHDRRARWLRVVLLLIAVAIVVAVLR